MRLLICAGGTGGGVFPALAILQALETKDLKVLWVGGSQSMDRELVAHAGLDFLGIPAAGVHGVNLLSLPRNLIMLAKGYFASLKILKSFEPEVLLFTGGYVAVPMAMAAHKYPSLLYVPDIEPGMALKFLTRKTSVIGITAEESTSYIAQTHKTIVCGYPVRKDLVVFPKIQAKGKLGLQEDLPVVLVMGGSKGARSINKALLLNLTKLLQYTQIIHITGELDWNEVISYTNNLSEELHARYYPKKFMHEEIAAAFSAADLVVSRAGASTLGEYPHFGLPAILVPYPYAWRYQKVNAQYLVNKNAAILLPNEHLEARLEHEIHSLLEDEKKLDEMSQNMQRLKKPDAAQKLAKLLELLSKGNKND